MNKTKLKPCPFCGGDASIIMVQRGFGPWKAVACHSCPQISGNEDEDRDNAVADWNRRVGQIDEVDVLQFKTGRAKWERGRKGNK